MKALLCWFLVDLEQIFYLYAEVKTPNIYGTSLLGLHNCFFS